MTKPFSRRGFLCTVPAACTAVAVFGFDSVSTEAAAGETPAKGNSSKSTIPDEFPRQDPNAVQDIVRFAHFNLDKVKELVSARPALAKASWDWGFGDWESALGAASHVGRRDIARSGYRAPQRKPRPPGCAGGPGRPRSPDPRYSDHLPPG